MASSNTEFRPRILVVDDDSAVLLTYRMVLDQSGFAVTTASSADEAEFALREQSFDLLLCDLGLKQERDGLDVIRKARELVPHIQAVLITGYVGDDLGSEVAEAGALLLPKPVEVPALLATLKKLADRAA